MAQSAARKTSSVHPRREARRGSEERRGSQQEEVRRTGEDDLAQVAARVESDIAVHQTFSHMIQGANTASDSPLASFSVDGLFQAGLGMGMGPYDDDDDGSGSENRERRRIGSRRRTGRKGDSHLFDFYKDLLWQEEKRAEEAFLLEEEREMLERYRLCRLANADLFQVRFVEEARWELRERREVIERRETLDRSRFAMQLLDMFVEYLVVGGGEWSEDTTRSQMLKREERGFRRLLSMARNERAAMDEREWTDYLVESDRWRWDVELCLRKGMHHVQVTEHQHRQLVTRELYPADLNRLMHVMELEWVELIRAMHMQLHKQLQARRELTVADEEHGRMRLRRRNRRIVREFSLLSRLLALQHTEEFERRLTRETADRVFGVLFNRETVQIKSLLQRTQMLNDSVLAALAERSRLVTNRAQAVTGTGAFGASTPPPPPPPAAYPASLSRSPQSRTPDADAGDAASRALQMLRGAEGRRWDEMLRMPSQASEALPNPTSAGSLGNPASGSSGVRSAWSATQPTAQYDPMSLSGRQHSYDQLGATGLLTAGAWSPGAAAPAQR